jgi:hypothetical protein
MQKSIDLIGFAMKCTAAANTSQGIARDRPIPGCGQSHMPPNISPI